MFSDIIFTLWLFLPAGLANMAPIFADHWGWLSGLDKPVDGGKYLGQRRILGDHKTWRGFIVGWLAAALLVLLQLWLYNHWPQLRDWYRIDFTDINLLSWITVLSFGALGGDAIKSFFKRRINIAPGKSWVPFDQIDYVIGTLLASTLVLALPLRYYVIATVLGLVLHPVSTFLGWVFKFKDEPL